MTATLNCIASEVGVPLDAARAAQVLEESWSAGLDNLTAIERALGAAGAIPADAHDALRTAWTSLTALAGAAA